METDCYSTIRSVHYSFIMNSSDGFRYPKLSETVNFHAYFQVSLLPTSTSSDTRFPIGSSNVAKGQNDLRKPGILTFIQNKSHKSLNLCNYSAGGSKGLCRPLSGVRGSPTPGVPAFLPHPAGGGARERRLE